MANPLPSSGLIRQVQLPGGGTYQIVDYSTTASKGYLQDQVDDMQNPNLEGSLQKQINDLSEIVGGGVNFKIAWTQANYEASTAPASTVLAQIPKDVVVYYNNGATSTSGTLVAGTSTKGDFILLYSKTQVGDKDKYDEYVTITTSTSPSTYAWEKIGDTQIDLTGIVTDVSLSTTSASVLGATTTAALTSGKVNFGTATSAEFLKSGVTFDVTQPTISVTPDSTYISISKLVGGGYDNYSRKWIGATASGTEIGVASTVSAITSLTATNATFVKNVATTVSKLATSTIAVVSSTSDVTFNGVTDAGTADTWSFTVAGDDNQTLIIGGANGTIPTLGQVVATKVTMESGKRTIATGSLAASNDMGGGGLVAVGVTVNDSGSALTGLNTPTTADVATEIEVVTNPIISLTANNTSGNTKIQAVTSLGDFSNPTYKVVTSTSAGTAADPRVQVLTGISSATATNGAVVANTAATGATANAITAIPTATVGTSITITKDTVNALTSASLSVTKG